MSLPTASIRSDIRSAWRGPTLLVVEPDVTAGGHALTGYYFRQTRFLRELRFEINGLAPHACSIADRTLRSLLVFGAVAFAGKAAVAAIY